MAWPPPVLPINRTNATPQLDTHAADHNALALAVNDIVGRVTAADGRKGTSAHQGGQSIAGGAVVSLSWEAVSDPSWGAGPTFTVPNVANTTGIYTLSLRVAGPTQPGPADVVIVIGGLEHSNYIPTNKASVAFCVSMQLTAGTQVFVRIYNPSASAQFYNADLHILRVAS
jgi:hypothetical protein